MGFLLSSIVLVAEFFVLSLIGSVIYDGYRKGRLNNQLLFFTLAYETVFNVGYMAIRALYPSASAGSRTVKLVGMFHGIFSLVMFLVAVAFLLSAWWGYRKGVNYFKVHKTATVLFCAAWLSALASGVFLYTLMYL